MSDETNSKRLTLKWSLSTKQEVQDVVKVLGEPPKIVGLPDDYKKRILNALQRADGAGPADDHAEQECSSDKSSARFR